VIPNIRCKSGRVVAVSARDGQVSELMDIFTGFDFLPDRTAAVERDFMMSVDHCFQVKGSGTVFTGTVLAGQVAIGDTVEVVHLKEDKKVKNIQIFREKSATAKCGDRAAICVTQFDAKKVERGLISKPGAVKSHTSVIVEIERVKIFKDRVASNQKFQLTCGHQLSSCKVTLFRPRDPALKVSLESQSFLLDNIFEFVDEMAQTDARSLALLEFDRPLYFLPSGLMIGSRLELDSNVVTTCRIAFSAQLAAASFFDRQRLKVVKLKSKSGTVERLHDPNTLIVKNLFKKETNFDLFNRLAVELSTGELATIDGTFGTTGKVKITNSSGFSDSTQNATRKAKKGETAEKKEPITVKLNFYKNIFATDKNSILQL